MLHKIEIKAAGMFALIAIMAFAVWRQMPPATIEPFRYVQSPQRAGFDLQYTADGRLLIAPGGNLVSYFDASSGDLVRQVSVPDGERSFSPDGSLILVGDYPGQMQPGGTKLIDGVTGRVIRSWSGTLVSAAYDGSLAIIARPHVQTKIKANVDASLVDVASGSSIARLSLPADAFAVGISRDDKWVCIPNDAGPSRIIYIPDMKATVISRALDRLVMSPTGRSAIGLTPDGTLCLVDLVTGRCTLRSVGLTRGLYVYLTKTGQIAVGGETGTGHNLEEVTQIRSANGQKLIVQVDGEAAVASANRTCIGAGEWNATGYSAYDIVDVQNGKKIVRLDASLDPIGQRLSNKGQGPNTLAIAPDGRHFACGGDCGLIMLYNLAKSNSRPHPFNSTSTGTAVTPGVELPTEPKSTDLRARPGLLHDGRLLVGQDEYKPHYEAFSDDRRLVVIDWNYIEPNTRALKTSKRPRPSLTQVRNQPAGRVISRLDTSELAYQFECNGQSSFAFSPDDSTFAAAGTFGTIYMWNVATGDRIGMLSCSLAEAPPGSFVQLRSAAIAFSPDGRFLAAVRNDGSIYLYSLKTMLAVALIGSMRSDYGPPIQRLEFESSGRVLRAITYQNMGFQQHTPPAFEWQVPKLDP